jgi:hypothetical protein
MVLALREGAFSLSARSHLLLVPRVCHSGKGLASPSANKGTQGNIFYFFVFPNFCEALPHYVKLLAQIWANFVFLYILLVFSFY